ncbi:MAG TPA: hypothetical protein VMT51_01105 [Dongiaceae bacterium]|nr:hypothetical protein [Dongiaceae bacterium]
MSPDPARPSASPGIIAAAAVAILAGIFGTLSNAFALAMFALNRISPSPLNPAMRPLIYGIFIFFVLCSLFVVLIGVQLIRLRNWARISILFVAGCLLLFGIVGLIVIFAVVYLQPPDPLVSKPMLASVLGVTYGIPIVVSIWWFIYFTRRSVVAQFHGSAPPHASSAPSWLNDPRCPFPVRVVGWYLASFVFVLPVLPFVKDRFPILFFNHLFHGVAGLGIFALDLAMLVAAGVGLLLIRPWGYWLGLASQALLCVNGVAAAFSPRTTEVMQQAMQEMHVPDAGIASQFLPYMRYFNLLGLLLPLAIIVTLLVCRRAYFAAAQLPQTPAHSA